MRSILKLCILFCIICSQTGCVSTPLKNAGPGLFFLNSIKLTNNRGLLGNYFQARLTARCDGDWGAQGIRVGRSDLPSGIFTSGLSIEGTPLNTGSYFVEVRVIAPYCNEVVYDDKQLWVNITIAGRRNKF